MCVCVFLRTVHCIATQFGKSLGQAVCVGTSVQEFDYDCV